MLQGEGVAARVPGVDGCPGGWVGALVSDGSVRWHTGDVGAMLV